MNYDSEFETNRPIEHEISEPRISGSIHFFNSSYWLLPFTFFPRGGPWNRVIVTIHKKIIVISGKNKYLKCIVKIFNHFEILKL